jgi:hypothetical protein
MLFLVKVSLPGVLESPVQTIQTSLRFELVRQVIAFLKASVFFELNGTSFSVFSVVASGQDVLLDADDRFNSMYRLVITPGSAPSETDRTEILDFNAFADGVVVRINGKPVTMLNHVLLFTDVLSFEIIQTAVNMERLRVTDVIIGEDPGRSSTYLNFDDVRAPGETVLRILCQRINPGM